MSNDARCNKVYKVIYGEVDQDDGEQLTVDSTKVIAKDVEQAIVAANKKIKTTPGYFVESIELITYLD